MPLDPTTEGSIVAYLRLNSDDFNAKLDAAESKARRLGLISPNIKVKVDAADAMAKMRALNAAADRLSRKRSLRFGASGGGNAGGGRGHGGTVNTPFGSYSPALLTGIVTSAIAILNPLLGYATAVSGALAGMGAAGVFAVLGIKNAMAEGTQTGQDYTFMMTALKSDLTDLETVSAKNVLGAFQKSVDLVTENLPELSSEIGGLAGALGQVVVPIVHAIIAGFEVLNPLFLQGARYVEQLAEGFDSWSSGGGLTEFATGALQTFPLVANLIGNLITLIAHLVEAFQPLGTIVLTVINAVAGALNLIPVPVLSALATAATVAFLAFKTWGLIAPLIASVAGAVFKVTDSVAALGVALDVTSGPIGLVVAGIGLLVGAFLGFASAANSASQTTSDYTQQLVQSNGAIDANIRATAAKALSDAGALNTAREYGLTLSTVTDAALGNAAALDQVNSAIQQHGMMTATETRALSESGRSTQVLTRQAQALRNAVEGQAGSFSNASQKSKDLLAAEKPVSTTQSDMSPIVATLTAALQTQSNTAATLTDAFKLLDGQSVGVMEAQTAQAAAVNTATDAMKKNKDAINGGSKAAVADQQSLQGVRDAAVTTAAAIATQTGSTDKGTQSFEKSKVALENQLRAQHLLTPAVQAYIDKLFKIPPELTTKAKFDDGQARAAATAFQRSLARITRQIDVNVVEHTYGVGTKGASPSLNFMSHNGQASGGTVGGPGSNTSDSVMSWLSRSEEVISNAHGQADRYRGLLKTINGDGSPAQVARAAELSTGSRTSGQPTVINHYHTWNVETTDPNALYQTFTAYTNARAAV